VANASKVGPGRCAAPGVNNRHCFKLYTRYRV
jgi:hypothetical protein